MKSECMLPLRHTHTCKRNDNCQLAPGACGLQAMTYTLLNCEISIVLCERVVSDSMKPTECPLMGTRKSSKMSLRFRRTIVYVNIQERCNEMRSVADAKCVKIREGRLGASAFFLLLTLSHPCHWNRYQGRGANLMRARQSALHVCRCEGTQFVFATFRVLYSTPTTDRPSVEALI